MKKIFATFLLGLIFFLYGGTAVHAALSDANVISYWALEEASGVRYDAETTNSNDLTDNNTVTSGTGNIGDAAHFTRANNEWLSITDANFTGFPTGSFSVSCGVNIDSQPGADTDMPIISKYGSTPNRSFYIVYGDYSSHRYLSFSVSGGDGTTIKAANADPVTDFTIGNWYHVVGVFTASTKLELFVNASSVGSNTTSIPATMHDSTADFEIGKAYGVVFNGLIDECMVYNGALTSTEVTELYNSGSWKPYPFTSAPATTAVEDINNYQVIE